MLSRFKNKSGGGDGADGDVEGDPLNRPNDRGVGQNSLLDLLEDTPKAGPDSTADIDRSDVVPFPSSPAAAHDPAQSGHFIDSPLLSQLDAADQAMAKARQHQQLQAGRTEQERRKQQAVREEIARDLEARQAQRRTQTTAEARPSSANHAGHLGSSRRPGDRGATDPRLAQLDLLSRELEALKTTRHQEPGHTAPQSAQSATAPVRDAMAPQPQPAFEPMLQREADFDAPFPDGRIAGSAGISAQAENPMSFGNFVRSLMRGWWMIMVCALAGAALAALYSLSLPNQYQSVAEVLIEPRGLKVLENSVAPTGLNREATVAFAESQVRIITSSSLLDPVIQDLELDQDPEFNGTRRTGGALMRFFTLLAGSSPDPARQLANARKTLYESIFVSRINQTFTIQIGATTEDPAKSARIANAIASAYLKDEAGAKSTAAQSATEDLSGRLDELRAKVRAGEEKVERYKAENGLVDADGKLVSDVQLVRLNDQLALAQIQTTDAQTKAEQARKAGLNDVLTGSLPSSLQSNALNQLRLAFSRAKSQRDRVATRLGVRHPERIAAESELQSARTAISSEIQRMIRSAQGDFQRAKARQAELVSQVNQLKGRAVNEAAAKVELRELQREVDASRRVFESILLRSRETGEESKVRSESARIISEAQPNDKKSGPARKLMVAGGMIAGGSLGAALALVPFFLAGLRGMMGPADGAPGGSGGSGGGRSNASRQAREADDGDLYAVDDAGPTSADPKRRALFKRTRRPNPEQQQTPPPFGAQPQPVAHPQPAPTPVYQQPVYQPAPVQAPLYPHYPPQSVHSHHHQQGYPAPLAHAGYPTTGYPPAPPLQPSAPYPAAQAGFFDPMTGQPLAGFSAPQGHPQAGQAANQPTGQPVPPYGYPPMPGR